MPPRARPSFDATFMEMCGLVSQRTTCPRRAVGAVIVKENHVLTTGYNGAPKGFPHPIETGCIREELGIPSGEFSDVCPCLHAEQNAILQAALFGVSVKEGTLYCTTQPCTQCARMVVNSGIRKVVYELEYADMLSVGLLRTGGVDLYRWDPKKKVAVRDTRSNTWQEAQEKFKAEYRKKRLAPRSRTQVRPGA
ncbi:MAG: dCMP deaminase family protein [Euryarchaeota archaeon]|nr:dCMP deaminase family protein [Euryarchaeota archaeon]